MQNIIKIWYLPYIMDTAQYTVLDPNESTIMLTAKMTGCTFGVGTATLNGSTIVTHTNANHVGGGPGQQYVQHQQAFNAIYSENKDANPKYWEPTDYRKKKNPGPTDAVLLYGIFSSKDRWYGGQTQKKWRFYQHKVETGSMYIVKSKHQRINRIV